LVNGRAKFSLYHVPSQQIIIFFFGAISFKELTAFKGPATGIALITSVILKKACESL
jgi:hypothetical protein